MSVILQLAANILPWIFPKVILNYAGERWLKESKQHLFCCFLFLASDCLYIIIHAVKTLQLESIPQRIFELKENKGEKKLLSIARNKELEKAAKRVMWFKEPAKALVDPYTFMAHVMTYGTLEDVLIIQKNLGMKSFHEVLNHLPLSIMVINLWLIGILLQVSNRQLPCLKENLMCRKSSE